jgi:enoyl-[acyl-carrier-protein] reductase (NADH)
MLAGKKILVTGLLSPRSIAYGIAGAMRREGAELAFTYQGERVRERVEQLAMEFDSGITLGCDVSSDAQIDAAFQALTRKWNHLDGLVHAIAFAPREALAGDFLEGLSRESYRVAHDVSAYSLAALVKAGLPMMRGRNAAVVTLLRCVQRNAPLRCNVTIEEVGNVAAFLCSDLASGITGEITYVDCGYNTAGVGDYKPPSSIEAAA